MKIKSLTFGHKKRQATYIVPTLGDSTGAGRVGLASCKYTIF